MKADEIGQHDGTWIGKEFAATADHSHVDFKAAQERNQPGAVADVTRDWIVPALVRRFLADRASVDAVPVDLKNPERAFAPQALGRLRERSKLRKTGPGEQAKSMPHPALNLIRPKNGLLGPLLGGSGL